MSTDLNTNVLINNQTRQMMMHGAAGGMNVGGANTEAFEPFHIPGLFQEAQRLLNSGCGVIQLAASLCMVKGIDGTAMFRRLEQLGLFNQITPSIFANLFQKSPNIFSNTNR